MAERKVNRRKLTKSAIGDLNQRISLERRVTVSPQTFDSPENTITLTQIAEVWAKVETSFTITGGQGDANYNNVNLMKKPQYVFTIRYRGDLSAFDTVVRYQNMLYRIDSIGDPEKRNEYEILNSTVRGLDTLAANQ